MGTHRLATELAAVTMKFFAVLATLAVSSSAQVVYSGLPAQAGFAGLGYHGHHAVAAVTPETTSSQFRSEDEAGNTAYGYQNINNAAQQSGNAYGGVQGSYSFRDKAGFHTVNYVADDLGYRVLSRNRRAAQHIGYA